ncbi:cytoplasmic tRNA 2-thiolation protein 1 [Striga asiatica]|uniref:Cytoplasmic tRNA 2-thiolation protein 1 n=1 Tax=Striga asiatica TaxID=4170 RepID=A0A5A7PMX1_STRAF|nr:cytoplasmic tRNA 2-thiolation protein 1 [Striga asiatica]
MKNKGGKLYPSSGMTSEAEAAPPPVKPRSGKLCTICNARRAALKRPKTLEQICKECFFEVFEDEIHRVIVDNQLFRRGERIAIGASGGKDSTVLAYVLSELNRRHDYGLDLFLLSIDEGITGYRDDSLETVKRNEIQYGLPLKVVSYKELYGWTMDEIVKLIGLKNNCTFCGVFRRQALDRGAALLKVDKLVTGHNADDIAETVLLNILRGDIARLSRCTSITTGEDGPIPRCKPFKYTYEKEIVIYPCYNMAPILFRLYGIYSLNAYRGFAREFIKDLERISNELSLDGRRRPLSGEIHLRYGLLSVSSAVVEIADGAPRLDHDLHFLRELSHAHPGCRRHGSSANPIPRCVTSFVCGILSPRRHRESPRAILDIIKSGEDFRISTSTKMPEQGNCERCGYISSQKWCKACVLLEGLNRGLPKLGIGRSRISDNERNKDMKKTNGTESLQSKQCGSLDF